MRQLRRVPQPSWDVSPGRRTLLPCLWSGGGKTIRRSLPRVCILLAGRRRRTPVCIRTNISTVSSFSHFFFFLTVTKKLIAVYRHGIPRRSPHQPSQARLRCHRRRPGINLGESVSPLSLPLSLLPSIFYSIAASATVNLLNASFYMRYAPDEEGNFSGQTGYGYISFEKFIDAVTAVNEGRVTLDQLDARPLPTLKNTIATTAILHAGRMSLDEKRPVEIVSEAGNWGLK